MDEDSGLGMTADEDSNGSISDAKQSRDPSLHCGRNSGQSSAPSANSTGQNLKLQAQFVVFIG